MFRDFRSKNGKCLKASRIYKIWSKTQYVNAKRRKIEHATKWPSQIFDIFRFWYPKLESSIFQKEVPMKSKILELSEKTEYML